MKSICINLGSNTGLDEIYKTQTQKLSKILVDNDITIIYGGADVGLMGILANTALKHGGKVIGVIPKKIKDKVAHTGLTKLYVTKDMHERKQKMFELSDGFIALPGGLGTIEEIFEILTWAQLGYHNKPFGFLNINSYFDYLIKFINKCVNQGFVKKEHRNMIIFEKDPKLIIQKLNNFTMLEVEKWITK